MDLHKLKQKLCFSYKNLAIGLIWAVVIVENFDCFWPGGMTDLDTKMGFDGAGGSNKFRDQMGKETSQQSKEVMK